MDLNRAIGALAGDLTDTAPEHDWSSVTHLLYYGEEEEGMDVLVAILVRYNVPISPIQLDRVREIMEAFGLGGHDRGIYRYLGDPEMLDRMTVVRDSR